MANLLANSIHIFYPVAIQAGAVLMVLYILLWLFNAFGELLTLVRGEHRGEFSE